jgi:hypothetical protein
MNIRILAASVLALAILVPAANAATEHHARTDHQDRCSNGDLSLGTVQCQISGAPFKAQNDKAHMLLRVEKAKPVQSASFDRINDRVQSILANNNDNN